MRETDEDAVVIEADLIDRFAVAPRVATQPEVVLDAHSTVGSGHVLDLFLNTNAVAGTKAATSSSASKAAPASTVSATTSTPANQADTAAKR